MPQNQDVTPSGPGFRASHGAASASPPEASIPNAVLYDAAEAFLAAWADGGDDARLAPLAIGLGRALRKVKEMAHG